MCSLEECTCPYFSELITLHIRPKLCIWACGLGSILGKYGKPGKSCMAANYAGLSVLRPDAVCSTTGVIEPFEDQYGPTLTNNVLSSANFT